MSFFDLFSADNSAAPQPSQQLDATNSVEIFAGASPRIRIPAAEAAGRPLSSIFAANAGRLGIDAARITRFTDAGQILSGSDLAQVGRSYQGAVNAETKGL
jgi:nucleoid-associated protein YgaU